MTLTTPLTGDHTAYLRDHAIKDETAAAFGVRSLSADEARQQGFAPHYVNNSGGILFSWPVPGREPVLQFRPDNPVTEDDKYVFMTGCGSFVAVFREPEDGQPWLFVEGTKQCLAAASWAPQEWGIAGTGGCDMWRGDPPFWATGRDVIVMFDRDVTANARVWDAADELKGALEQEDVASVRFAVVKGAGTKDGLDDVLTKRPGDMRTAFVEKLAAKALPSLGRRPKDGPRKAAKVEPPDTGGRVGVPVNLDRKMVIELILGAIKDRWDGKELFNFGGAITRLYGPVTEPLEKGSFLALLPDAVAAFHYTEATGSRPAKFEPAWPDTQTVAAVMSKARDFIGLDRIMQAPFVRKDGSVCTASGYDEASRTWLALADGLTVDVPDDPTLQQIHDARELILTEWLGDMPFPTEADRTNALALILTPFVRDRIDLAPMAVIDGLQMGVGKNLLADVISIIVYGHAAVTRPMSSENEEVRKTVTSALRRGEALVVFDESHVIQGRALAQALTSETWSDRVLGVSEDIHLPNMATWLALGNQVTVNADCVRRVYWIRLAPEYANPQDRAADSFRHPDLKEWTTEHRGELLTAVLTLIRAWYAAGCGYVPRGESFGSFTRWEKTVGGIVQTAGLEGFLAGITDKRHESDFVGTVWVEHLSWLVDQFGESPFTCGHVHIKAMSNPGEFRSPPGLEDVGVKGWGRMLGNAYRGVIGVNKKGMTLIKLGQTHNNVAQYTVAVNRGKVVQEEDRPGGVGGDGGIATPTRVGKHSLLSGPYMTSNKERAHVYRGQTVPPSPPVPPDGGKLVQEISTNGVEVVQAAIGGDSREVPASSPQGGKLVQEIRTNRGEVVQDANLAPGPIGFDLETADGGALFTYGPEFVRLAGVIDKDGKTWTGVPPAELVEMINNASEVYGHNILGFDGLALAHWHGLDWEAFCAKAVDTEPLARQADPPRSRQKGSADRYDLDHIAVKLGVPGKVTGEGGLAALKRKHGGYDKIPQDDPDYRAYLVGDLKATKAVRGILPQGDYTRREHRIAALMGRMTLNGFKVDVPLLEERIRQGEEKKQAALSELHSVHGLPLSRQVLRGPQKAKYAVTETFSSPLATTEGIEWLTGVWNKYGVHTPPRTDKGKLSTAADVLEGLARYPQCPEELKKIISLMGTVTTTRTVYQTAQKFLTPQGRVHPTVSMRQASGRGSVTGPGMTVFGKHNGRHTERDVFTADDGHVLITCDLSQVDMRAVAGHCQDEAYTRLFEPGRDAHQEIADLVGVTRQDAKAIGHGWNYGLGAKSMIEKGRDPELVYAFINGMAERFPRLIEWKEEVREIGASGTTLDNGFGRMMRCDPQYAYTVAPALMGQGTARDITCEVLLRLMDAHPDYKQYLRTWVHDEFVFSVPVEQAAEIGEQIRQAFTWSWKGVPILCDLSGPGATWGAVSQK